MCTPHHRPSCRTHSARRFCVRVPRSFPSAPCRASPPLAATLVRCTTSDLSAVSRPRTDFAVRAIRLHRAAMLSASRLNAPLLFPSRIRRIYDLRSTMNDRIDFGRKKVIGFYLFRSRLTGRGWQSLKLCDVLRRRKGTIISRDDTAISPHEKQRAERVAGVEASATWPSLLQGPSASCSTFVLYKPNARQRGHQPP